MVQRSTEERGDAHETRPLLSPSAGQTGILEAHAAAEDSPAHRSRCTWPWTHVIGLVLSIAIISDFSESMFTAPRIRLYESVICAEFYSQADPSLVGPDGSVPERLCKVVPVQEELATILGWQSFIDSIPAILLPIPFGYLADKYGRKWIMTLGLVGFTLAYAWIEFVVCPPEEAAACPKCKPCSSIACESRLPWVCPCTMSCSRRFSTFLVEGRLLPQRFLLPSWLMSCRQS